MKWARKWAQSGSQSFKPLSLTIGHEMSSEAVTNWLKDLIDPAGNWVNHDLATPFSDDAKNLQTIASL